MTRGAEFRLPTDVRPARYDLRFDLDLDAWRFRGSERLEIVVDGPRREIVLHARDLAITRAVAVSAAGAFLAAVTAPDSLEVVRRTRESLHLQSRAAERIREELAELG